MTRQECIDRISTAIDEMWDGDIANIWNEYCDSSKYYDDRVYSMDELDCCFENYSPTKLLALGKDSSIYWGDDWFTFDGYGNIETISNLAQYIDTEAVAKYCIDYQDSFGYSVIEDILDDYADEEDEEE